MKRRHEVTFGPRATPSRWRRLLVLLLFALAAAVLLGTTSIGGLFGHSDGGLNDGGGGRSGSGASSADSDASDRDALRRAGLGSTSVSSHELLSAQIGRWYYVEKLHRQLLHTPFAQMLPASFAAATALSEAKEVASVSLNDATAAARNVGVQPGDTFYEPRWEAVFGAIKSSIPASDGSNTSRLSVASTCSNIVLQSAPWCNSNISRVADVLLAEPLAVGDVATSDSAESPLGSVSQAVSDDEFVRQEAAKAHAARDRVVAHASSVLRRASRLGKVNDEDLRLVSGVKWRTWPSHGPSPTGDTAATPHVALVSAQDFEGDQGAGGSVHFRRTGRSYNLLLALRRDENDPDAMQPGTAERPFDKDDDLIGFHACMFGVKRNLTSTIERIVHNVLGQMQPQRFHVVTNDAGYQEMLPALKTTSDEDGAASARAAHFNDFLSIVSPFASTFVATRHDAASAAHNCTICRGFFQREICRVSILSDMQRGIPVELVILFRPDMYSFQPLYLQPYTPHSFAVNLDDPRAAETSPTTVPVVNGGPFPSTTSTPITKWRLHTKPLYTLIIDKGFLPGAFGVINDINISATTVVVHARVTFPMDLHWIGDPVVLGHWTVMNHWMEMFSVTTGSPRLGWDERNSGEMHHHEFYYSYIRPLFSAVPHLAAPVEIKVFDFQFSLFRADPVINKQIMSLPFNYAAYQQQTIFLKFATKWETAECMRYIFVPREFNVTSFYSRTLEFRGEIGKLKLSRVPMRECQNVATPPGLQTCFTQYQRIIYYKKGRNIHNPCKPYCGVIPIMFREGLCLHVGNKGPKRKYLATFSVSPMVRNESGEVLRFNVVNPQYVRGDKHHIKKEKLLEMSKKEKEKEKEKQLQQLQQPDRREATHLDEEDKELISTLRSQQPSTPPPQQQQQQSGGGSGAVFRKGSKKYRYVSRTRRG